MATVAIQPSRTSRFAEVFLLFVALLIGLSGYMAVVFTRTGKLPSNLKLHLGVLVALTLVTYLAVRLLVPHADPTLLPIAVCLNGLGLAMIYRLDLAYAQSRLEEVVGYRQLLYSGLGVLTFIIVLLLLRDHRQLRKVPYIAMFLALVLLLLPAVPGLSAAAYGANNWIRIPGFGTIQPSEFAKILLAIFFAGYLVDRRDSLALGGKKILGIHLPRWRDLGPLLMVWVVAILVLVVQRDLGMSLLLFGLFVAMIYISTNRVSWLILGGLLFIPAVFLAIHLFNHVWVRFNIWINAMDPHVYNAKFGNSYQLVQGIFGMANGGLFGTGWGAGSPSLVPFANSDFILASFAEELGLFGISAIVVLYLILIQRGMRTALGIRDGFGKLLASGLSFGIALQVFVVLGGLTRIIPLTGLTAPFLSKGGSSLISSWIVVALLLRMSDFARRPQSASTSLTATEVNRFLALSDLDEEEPEKPAPTNEMAAAGSETDQKPADSQPQTGRAPFPKMTSAKAGENE